MFSKFNLKKSLRLFFTGFTMGSADVVPGVSGGTVAFIFGIYEELLHSIKVVSGEVLRLFLKGKIREGWAKIPFGFLLPVGLGILTALVSLASALSYLLQTYPIFLWAFFFGLVLASIWVVRKRVVTWNPHDYIAMAITAVVAYLIVGAVPVETPNTLPALFVSGAIAICAMILPGVSGSFLLVIMGKYEQVLGAISNRDVLSLAVFGAGTVVGLVLFSRLLTWLFKKHHDLIVSILIGFMIGSLRKIWPWKEVLMTRLNSHGEIVPIVEKNVLPFGAPSQILIAFMLAAVGFAVIFFLESLQATKEQVKDVEDRKFETEHKKSLETQKKGKI